MLGEGRTDGWYGVGTAAEKFSISFSKENSKFSIILNYSGNDSYLLVNRKIIYKIKTDNKYIYFPNVFQLP